MGIAIDLIVIAFIVISFMVMVKKGFVKALASISGTLVTIILVSVFLTPVTEALLTTELADVVRKNVEATVVQSQEKETEKEDEENNIFPAKIMDEYKKSSQEFAKENIAPVITDAIMRIIALIILIIATKIIVWLLFIVLEMIFKIPVLSGLNKIAGGLAGIINALLVIYIICAVLSLNFEWTNDLLGIVDQTTVLKYFYLNNILINIFC